MFKSWKIENWESKKIQNILRLWPKISTKLVKKWSLYKFLKEKKWYYMKSEMTNNYVHLLYTYIVWCLTATLGWNILSNTNLCKL
jgi:hypothetical protein